MLWCTATVDGAPIALLLESGDFGRPIYSAANGDHLDGAAPTKESFLHLAMYRARPGSGAVVHTPSTHSVAVSCLADLDTRNALAPLTAYYAMRVGRLPLLPYHAPGDPALGPSRKPLLRNIMLLDDHGPVVAGVDLHSAADALEELEERPRCICCCTAASPRRSPRLNSNVFDRGDPARRAPRAPVGSIDRPAGP